MRKNGEVLKWFTETKNQGRRAIGLRGHDVREWCFWRGERERDGFVGFEREEEGKRNLGVLVAMGDGKEIFCRKIGFWLCVVEFIVLFVKCSRGTSGLDSVKLSFTPNPCWI